MSTNGNGSGTDVIVVEALTLQRFGRDLFRDMSWSLKAGRFLAITGPSGVGKSSMLAALTGNLKPSRGNIFISAAAGASIIFQDNRLTKELSVLKNVLAGRLSMHSWTRTVFGFPAAEKNEAFGILADLGIEHLCHKKAGFISGGEQQRTAIARALFQQPSLIIADEPTSNLDHTLSEKVLQMLFSECRDSGRTAVCVLHDTEYVGRFADMELQLGPQFENGWRLLHHRTPK